MTVKDEKKLNTRLSRLTLKERKDLISILQDSNLKFEPTDNIEDTFSALKICELAHEVYEFCNSTKKMPEELNPDTWHLPKPEEKAMNDFEQREEINDEIRELTLNERRQVMDYLTNNIAPGEIKNDRIADIAIDVMAFSHGLPSELNPDTWHLPEVKEENGEKIIIKEPNNKFMS